MIQINKVAVLGAGVMGSGIAAQVANGGIPVVLLDIVLADKEDRNYLANAAMKTQNKVGGFMHSSATELVQTGNLDDDLELLADVDLIIEVVTEQLDIKESLYARIDKVRKEGSIVASNTSTIPLAKLVANQSDVFKRDFAVTHFFNPPRHMRLLELVVGDNTDPEIAETLKYFCDFCLGKTVVDCNDTPGFIANRIGIFWLQTALHEAIELGITVEEADTLIGKAFGIPKTGVFGLYDLIGIDTMIKISESLVSTLPESDLFHAVAATPDVVKSMLDEGCTGRKAKAGFYRISTVDNKKVFEVRDFANNSYRQKQASVLESCTVAQTSTAATLLSQGDKGSDYAWRVMSKTLAYAASLIPEIADDISSVDSAMELGYAWQFGPFKLLDRIGVNSFSERLKSEATVPVLLQQASENGFYYTVDGKQNSIKFDGNYSEINVPEGVISFADIKSSSKAIIEDDSASLWDLGDGVACLEFHTKGNALNDSLLQMIKKSLVQVENDYKALVIYNEGRQFCSGANLDYFKNAIEDENYAAIQDNISDGQSIYRSLQLAPFPVIGAPAGLVLGGGCEVLLHCDHIQAHAETYMGLVEQSVGLVPGWGGCKELLIRRATKYGSNLIDIDIAEDVFDVIANAGISSSALDAISEFTLDASASITMNRERLLADAKSKALELSEDYQPLSSDHHLSIDGQAIAEYLHAKIQDNLRMKAITEYDSILQKALVKIVSANGKNTMVTEQDLLNLEQQVFDQLVRESGTYERIEHMLSHRKPLKN